LQTVRKIHAVYYRCVVRGSRSVNTLKMHH